jgi:RsiW-degrading membrane proteinase PrsW (M82 family)
MIRPDTRLLPPPQEEEISLYRPVWRSVAVESGIIFIITLTTFIVIEILGFRLSQTLNLLVGIGLALSPAGLWLLFSWFPERSVPQPRQRLLGVLILSGLAANAVGIPLMNDFFQINQWLPLSSAVNRIVGYTFTVGIIQETLKYLVLRYAAWKGHFRTRLDGVAYGAASAIGYATVLNLHFVISYTPLPDVTALQVFANLALHFATSFIVGYGLAETRFGSPTPFLGAVTIALAAFMTGIAVPIRAGLVNASFSLGVSTPRPLFGLGFSVGLLIITSTTLLFLFSSSEQAAREAAAPKEENA